MQIFWILAVVLGLGFSGSTSAAPLSGKLFERGTKTPLSEVSIFILPHKLKAITNGQGEFSFPDLPEGPFSIVVNSAGFLKLEQQDYVTGRDPVSRTLYLERASYDAYETTVTDKKDRRDDSRRSLKASQVKTLPGSGGDPIKAIQNLPGVNRAAPFSSQVIIQGSAPKDTVYMIDGHEVPIIFHFGGLSSVVPPEALDRVDYLTAGYGAEYGRALGGLVGVWTRSPRNDRIHGQAFVDLVNAGGLIEGPVGSKGRFLFGVRQSYVGVLLKAITSGNSKFNLTVAPTFGDILGIYEQRLTSRDDFKIVSVGSSDNLSFLLKQPADLDPSLRGQFETNTKFFRLIPQLTHRHSEITTSRWSLGVGRDWINFKTAENNFAISTWSLTVRGELERQWTSSWTSQFGLDNQYTWARVDILLPSVYFDGGVPNPFSSGELLQVGLDTKSPRLGIFWRNEVKASERLTLFPSGRLEYVRNSWSDKREITPLARMALRYQVNPGLSYRAATGTYTQAPEERESSPTFGNTQISSPRSIHGAVGFERDYRGGGSRGIRWSSSAYYRKFSRLVIPTTDGSNYSNSGEGRSYGLENLIQADFLPWSGWVSYTLGRSLRRQPGQSEFPSQYDQTHLITAILARDLGNNWRIGGRARYVTGNPSTPITGGIYDSDNDIYFPIRGAYFSDRLDPFFQLDVRIDKKWIKDTWILTGYLDIQNVTNRKNPEQFQYAYNYSARDAVAGLPIIPTLGVQAEF
ncbi:MAG: TonB-dependent receptor plug domain-containing protein [Bdellovibrionales bacterium]|nr:TonB-dependent receptor plug domain-containing protein [Bdellovibrionales bacterium]